MLVTFLMLHGGLLPGYDYLIARRFISLWRELAASPLRDDMQRFVAATRELGFADTVARGAGSLVAARVLIQTGKPLAELIAEDLDEFESALGERDERTHRPSAHYRRVLFTTRSTLYHLGISWVCNLLDLFRVGEAAATTKTYCSNPTALSFDAATANGLGRVVGPDERRRPVHAYGHRRLDELDCGVLLTVARRHEL